jgi:hypothetical protein
MTAQPQRRVAERRRTARQKSFLRGTIHFNNRRSAIDCLVRDISQYGARLTFADSVTVPDVVDLYIPQKDQTLRCHVIWRNGPEAGVAFPTATIGATGDSNDLSSRLARLESEVAALKRTIRQMKPGGPHDFDPD